jgi:hypothetical protein
VEGFIVTVVAVLVALLIWRWLQGRR